MDIDTNSNGNSNQVGKLTVLIGSDPFLPQPDSPTVEPKLDTVNEDLNTPPLPSPSVTPEYQTEDLTKPLHPYLEAGICLDTKSKWILETPSPLDENPPLTELSPVDPDIFVINLRFRTYGLVIIRNNKAYVSDFYMCLFLFKPNLM